jgi:hypothetical protein
VTYAGQQIDDLCVSKFTIWNSGNKTLNRDDMVTSKELTISATDESRILDAELIACSEETNKFSVQIIDKHTAKVLFDYVDKREGAVVQILHTVTNDTLKIDCKIKGGLPIKNFVNEIVPNLISKMLDRKIMNVYLAISSSLIVLSLFVIAMVTSISIFCADLRSFLFAKPIVKIGVSSGVEIATPIVLSAFFWIYFLCYWVLCVPMVKKRFKIGIPSALRKYSSFVD